MQDECLLVFFAYEKTLEINIIKKLFFLAVEKLNKIQNQRINIFGKYEFNSIIFFNKFKS